MCVNHDVSVYPFFLRRFISQRIWSVSTDCLSMLFILLFYQITDNRLICHNHTLAQASLLIHTGMLGFLLLSSNIILQLVCISIMLVCKGPPRFKRIKFISLDFLFIHFITHSLSLYCCKKSLHRIRIVCTFWCGINHIIWFIYVLFSSILFWWFCAFSFHLHRKRKFVLSTHNNCECARVYCYPITFYCSQKNETQSRCEPHTFIVWAAHISMSTYEIVRSRPSIVTRRPLFPFFCVFTHIVRQ